MRRWILSVLLLFGVVSLGLALAWVRLTSRNAPARVAPTAAQGAAATPTRAGAAPGDMHILLLGCDLVDGDPSWRTDTIMVATIREKPASIALFSIPRDLWVTIPGHGENRINVVDYLGEQTLGKEGGPALLAETLQQNLGIPVERYVRIRFEGLVQAIDALGGITLTVEHALPEYGIEEGVQHVDGETALSYARDRSRSNDLDRTRRQQQILLAIREAALQPGALLQLPGLARTLSTAVETDLDAGQAASLLALAMRIDPDSIRTRVFDATMVRDWVTPQGAMVLLPNRQRIQQAWAELTSPTATAPGSAG